MLEPELVGYISFISDDKIKLFLYTNSAYISVITTSTLSLDILLQPADDVNRGIVVKNILCLQSRREISKQYNIERCPRTENIISVCSYYFTCLSWRANTAVWCYDTSVT